MAMLNNQMVKAKFRISAPVGRIGLRNPLNSWEAWEVTFGSSCNSYRYIFLEDPGTIIVVIIPIVVK